MSTPTPTSSRTSKRILAGTVAALALTTVAACGSDDNDATTAASTATEAASSATTMADRTETTMSGGMSGAMATPFGPACSAVPTTGEGSVVGMADDPVATAASNNPVLSSLVGAVQAAGLVDTLNSAQDITVFAPSNDAFAKLDTATMDAAMADPQGLLSTVLTYHVVPGRLAPEDLSGTLETLQGGTITVEGMGEEFTVNGANKVVCGNVQTANATVYIIDGVLLPTAS